MDKAPLEQRIESLLEQAEHADHPLRAALAELYLRYSEQNRQIDRIAHIADRYQGAERERRLDSAARYQRKLRQIEKVMRISDRYQHMLRDVNERLQWISSRDDLTGLPNRRHMQARLKRELQLLEERQGGFCVALADVDHFKRINDSFGHDVGDQVLTAIADCLHQHIRDADLCGRWGGEEFLLIFPHTDDATAAAIIERLQEAVATLETPQLNINTAQLSLSLSFGLTVCSQADEAPDRILKRVDRALYQAKNDGRRRTVVV